MKRLAVLAAAVAVAGCTKLVSGDYPRGTPMVAAGNVNVTSNLQIPIEKFFYWGIYAGAAYLILDPWAPNWAIEEAKLDEDKFYLSLHMKRVYTGGAGEAREVFHHRARDLIKTGDFSGYDVLEYTESLESSVFGSQRVARGVIQLTRRD